ncbi:aminotransferase class I/II-fold pyridoxal phosphate-dependent enzyme [Streptomyces sp. NPDC047117]|uniref:pyridoxal phosphate-dependent aminotransferase n=1 Tax=Streptomyces sp. NPDC047117 TaxID=3155379 RepID=UPI0033DC4F5C
MTMHSATLAINETIRARRAAGEKVLHLGFGEAGLPVPDDIAAVLSAAAGRNGYGPVVGEEAARAAAAGWFTRRGTATGPEQVLFAPGSKALLFALLAALPGDVVLPCPAWVSYAAQAALAGKRVIDVPVPDAAGGVPDPALLEDALAAARADGARPGVLILTVPDNPTGTVAREADVRAVCEIAERHGLVVVSDEIYAEVLHPAGPDADSAGQDAGGSAGPRRAPSAVRRLPERTVVTSGLSKSMALGGWRIGFARVPAGAWGERLMRDLTGVASEIWSSLAAPMQAAAAHILADPPEVRAHIDAARRLHGTVARAVHAELTAAGAHCRAPEAGFYLYPDFEPMRPVLAAQGITTGAGLAAALLERHGVGVLAGEAFGDAPERLRARVATSLLYGETADERRSALRSPDPPALPWIEASLAHLREALTALTAPDRGH